MILQVDAAAERAAGLQDPSRLPEDRGEVVAGDVLARVGARGEVDRAGGQPGVARVARREVADPEARFELGERGDRAAGLAKGAARLLLELVRGAGFELVRETPSGPSDEGRAQLLNMPLAERFRGMPVDDLGVTILSFVAR